MPNVSEYPGPIFTYFTGLVIVLVGMIIPIFVWRSHKGRCYSNQLNLGDVRRRHAERPLLFGLAFDNALANCQAAFKGFNGNNLAALYTNLVDVRPIILEFTLLKRAIFAAIRLQLDDDLYSSCWRSETNRKFAILIVQQKNKS